MKLLLFILCLSNPFYITSTLNSDGLILLSLLNHWTSVPPSLKSSWKSSDSTPCSWIGIKCDRYSNVVFLNLTASQIFGQLGPEIGQLTHLQNLSLAINGFSGTIPPELGNCSLLEYIDLSKNQLSGKMPPEIGNCKSLKSLRLYSNQLEGPIPNKLGILSQLEDLELYSNHLTGKIPVTIWKIQSVKHVLVHDNNLTGKLSSELTELKHLKNISLSDNQFFGPIPQGLGINSSLVMLSLMNNTFTGNIPPNLCFGKQLRTLYLGLNQLQGGIPQDLGKCATLARLVLNDNNLSGSIPKFEGNQNLIIIDISKNNISGVIPSSLGNCTNLIGLMLSTNNIIGLIPSELGNLVKLQVLNLAHNNLVGILPLQLSNCTQMSTFDVGFNFLNGSFPSSIRSWTRINRLILRENHFSGFVPYFFSEYAQLLELQLGGNMIQGTIPASIGSLVHLYELNLSANKLTVGIPQDVGKLKMLESLDISLNSLTGSIQILGELVSLTEVNISYNSFFGPLPERTIQLLDLYPSSFFGNPGLCVSCSTSDGPSCIKTSHLKPCATNSTDQEGNKHSNLVVLGLIVFVICWSSIIFLSSVIYLSFVIYIRQFGQISYMEVNVNCEEQEALFSNHEGGFRIIDLMDATDFLHDRYIIGEGGHGIVYKAELGVGVFAVKKVKLAGSNRRKLNLVREIEMTKNFRHQNLARCLGSWICEEYGLTISRCMENGSLNDVLHESNPQTCLAWNVRYKIAIGITKGLAYLHHDCDPPILHRDIKPKNILLDSDMQPCISDFGISITLDEFALARLRSTYHLGTRGFMAPEIACLGVTSCELDVYSYGVLLLELITRKKVLDSSFMEEETTLVVWFKSIWKRTRELEEIVDSSIAREISDLNVMVQVMKVLLVALMCTETNPGKRLKMRDAAEFFETSIDPGIFVQHDRASFHLGNSLATAAASIFFEEEVDIPASEGSFPILHILMDANTNPNNLNIIGRGTHGVVYKVPLGPVLVYAVKKVAFAGNKRKIQSIVREVKILGKIRHPNIVRLLDFSFTKDYCLILYNYMINGNLHDVLHETNPPPSLEWNVRYRIAAGIAEGLAHLHYVRLPAIVHCDIKAKNILLDSDMEPHIADFGIAKPSDQSSSSTPSSPVSGTLENAYTTANTREFDVYSYGVVLLQLITRKKAMDLSFMEGTEVGIWVRTLWEETGDIHKIVDSSLAEEVRRNSDVLEPVTKLLLLALSCTEQNPHMRPTMRDVTKQLQDKESFQVPTP
ncbi:receptor-like protein kinase isoform X2 [Prosopis cineraria]|uniref:receptor-like protein kinase isoform X2 n=1 Tax=Prosopis cineraria TaxID=364024 RepID=UPI00240FC0F2|nr:receptor-like protein kinase isoform X2 [Prosopis cineraria]